MKNQLCYLFLAIMLPGISFAQIANSGFENWSGNVPDNWTSNNLAPLNLYPITPSNDSHSGSFAARGEVLDSPITPGNVYGPLLQSSGSPLTSAPGSISGWYKFSSPQPTSSLLVSALTVDADGAVTGIATGQFYTVSSTYSSFALNIDYSFGSNEPTVGISISVLLANDQESSDIGAWFLLDDLALNAGTVGLNDLSQEPFSFNVSEAYPQPSAQSATLRLNLERPEMIRVEIRDVQGRLLETLVNSTLGQGEHLLTWNPHSDVPSGLYIARISNGKEAITRSLLLQRE